MLLSDIVNLCILEFMIIITLNHVDSRYNACMSRVGARLTAADMFPNHVNVERTMWTPFESIGIPSLRNEISREEDG